MPAMVLSSAHHQCDCRLTPLPWPQSPHNDMDDNSPRPTIYDFTRLATRFLNETPNGIDRVDLRLARHFAFNRSNDTHALLWTIAGPRLFPATLAQDLVLDIEEHWQDSDR